VKRRRRKRKKKKEAVPFLVVEELTQVNACDL
jgi:hypothetical protein